MLTCREVADRTTDYIERDLSLWGRWQVRMHLLMCALCRRHVKHMEITRAALRKVQGAEEPPSKVDPALVDAYRNWRHERRER